MAARDLRDLREARERRGLSLDEASRQTRIPARYVDALEKGDLTVFGRGPFAAGYTRQYRKFLGLPDRPFELPDEPEPTVTHTVTGPVLPSRNRMVAFGVVLMSALALATLVSREAMRPAEPSVGEPADQVVLVTTAEPLRANIQGDARNLFSGIIQAGQQQTFEAHDELILDLARLDGVTIVYNGRTLTPLGAQSRPRRLHFIDDRGR